MNTGLTSVYNVRTPDVSVSAEPLADSQLRAGSIANSDSEPDNVSKDCPSDFSDNDNSDGICSICLEGFAPGQRVCLLLECEHMFHRDCLHEWWSRASCCPNCREQMVWPCVCMVI